MERDIYTTLCDWKTNNSRRPLLLRGARQVGKTFIIKEFGQNEFENIVNVNFERNPEYKEIFTNNSPLDIVEKIELFITVEIETGKTLLFILTH